MTKRIIKVWNKTVTIQNVPDYITNTQLEEWAKKKLLFERILKQHRIAS